VSEPVLLHEDTINKLAEVLAEKIRAPEKWIDAETLAAHFGVSLDTVYYWSSKTNIPQSEKYTILPRFRSNMVFLVVKKALLTVPCINIWR
jgi:hypothetical protein